MKRIDRIDVSLYGNHVGTLAIVNKEVYFEYSASFCVDGFSISPLALPLKSGVVKNSEKEFDGLFGVFNDSLPDGWGRLLTDKFLIKQGISLRDITPLDRLSLVGKNGMGALEYHPSSGVSWDGCLEIQLANINEMAQKILLEKDTDDEELTLLKSLNGDSCGARPKINVLYDKAHQRFFPDHATIDTASLEHWLIKFPSSYDSEYATNIEYAYSLMAKECGIGMSETALFSTKTQDFFGTKRFDRTGSMKKLHVHTLSGILCSDHRNTELDYEHLIQIVSYLTRSEEQVQKAFALACFNVLAHNRDDHGKNFALCCDEQGVWTLSPAYDLTFSKGPNHWQSMSVLGEAKEPSIKDLVKLAKKYQIKDFQHILDKVCAGLGKWRVFADKARVPSKQSLEVEQQLNNIAKNN